MSSAPLRPRGRAILGASGGTVSASAQRRYGGKRPSFRARPVRSLLFWSWPSSPPSLPSQARKRPRRSQHRWTASGLSSRNLRKGPRAARLISTPSARPQMLAWQGRRSRSRSPVVPTLTWNSPSRPSWPMRLARQRRSSTKATCRADVVVRRPVRTLSSLGVPRLMRPTPPRRAATASYASGPKRLRRNGRPIRQPRIPGSLPRRRRRHLRRNPQQRPRPRSQRQLRPKPHRARHRTAAATRRPVRLPAVIPPTRARRRKRRSSRVPLWGHSSWPPPSPRRPFPPLTGASSSPPPRHRRGGCTAWPPTTLEDRSSCSGAFPRTAMPAKPGPGTAPPGHSGRRPPRRQGGWHRLWPTTPPAPTSCSSAGMRVVPTRGRGTGPPGPGGLPPTRRRRGSTRRWPTTRRGARSCSLEARPSRVA
jgi:hypothetical protein